jgi:phage repressor protein C with HTH and peptisase S24 domain
VQLALQKAQAEINRLAMDANRLRAKQSKSKSKRKSAHKTEEVCLSSETPPTPGREEMLFSSKTVKFENDELKSLQQNFTKEVLTLKMEIKRKQKEITDLRLQLDQYANGDRKIEDEFGKSLQEIIEDYRKVDQRRTLLQSKSVKVLQQWR